MATPTRLSKSDAISRWENLDDGTPLKMVPIEAGQTGSTYAEDAIRLTGSQDFIDGCLSRLKGLLEYENESESRLEILYTQTCERYKNEDGKLVAGELTGSYACYVKAKSRGSGRGHRGGRKPGSKNKPKEGQEPRPEKVPGKRGRPPKAVAVNGEAAPNKESLPVKKHYVQADTVATATKEKRKTAPSYIDALYAMATAWTDGETGERCYDWLEPIGDHPLFPMQTYDDVSTFDDSIDRIAKMLKIHRTAIQKVEVIVQNDGTLKFEEF